jgi:hypothetical protein
LLVGAARSFFRTGGNLLLACPLNVGLHWPSAHRFIGHIGKRAGVPIDFKAK